MKKHYILWIFIGIFISLIAYYSVVYINREIEVVDNTPKEIFVDLKGEDLEFIEKVEQYGLYIADEGPSFFPEITMKRIEVFRVLSRLIDVLEIDYYAENYVENFEDVQSGDDYYQDVIKVSMFIQKDSIHSGHTIHDYLGYTISHNDSITKGELGYLLSHFLSKAEISMSDNIVFEDVSNEFMHELKYLYNSSVIQGNSSTLYGVNDLVPRKIMIILLSRLDQYLEIGVEGFQLDLTHLK